MNSRTNRVPIHIRDSVIYSAIIIKRRDSIIHSTICANSKPHAISTLNTRHKGHKCVDANKSPQIAHHTRQRLHAYLIIYIFQETIHGPTVNSGREGAVKEITCKSIADNGN